MFKKKHLILIAIIFLLIIILNFFQKIYYKNQKISGTLSYEIFKILPSDLKNFLKKTVFIIPTLKREIELNKKSSEHFIYKSKNIESKYNLTLEHLNNNKNPKDSILIKKINENIINIDKKKFKLEYFQLSSLKNPKHENAISTAYLANFENKIIIGTGDGDFYYFLTNEVLKNKFLANKINSNIDNKLNYSEFREKSLYGLKDIFIKNNKIYISASTEKEKNCFNTSIFFSEINFSFFKFEILHSPDCVLKELEDADSFSPYNAGGRIANYDENHILFSIGEWRNRSLAQNIESNLGKIIKINIVNFDTKIISMGHRNAQGLYFDEKNKVIISTEHGSIDGDEININKEVDKKVVNFGWPISSYSTGFYGEEYWKKKGISYDKMPLYKSHSKYGFQEPIKYYTPAVGPSQIIKIDEKFKKQFDKQEFFLAKMGSSVSPGLGFSVLKFNENYSKLEEENHFFLNERVRDIVYVEDINKYFFFFETSGSIGILSEHN